MTYGWPNENWESHFFYLSQAVNDRQVVPQILSESNTRVQNDFIPGDTRFGGDIQAFSKLVFDIIDDIVVLDAGISFPQFSQVLNILPMTAVVHDDYAGVMRGDHLRDLRVCFDNPQISLIQCCTMPRRHAFSYFQFCMYQLR